LLINKILRKTKTTTNNPKCIRKNEEKKGKMQGKNGKDYWNWDHD